MQCKHTERPDLNGRGFQNQACDVDYGQFSSSIGKEARYYIPGTAEAEGCRRRSQTRSGKLAPIVVQ